MFFYKIFEDFNNDLCLWKSEVTTIKNGKIFIISLNIAHIWKKKFFQNLITTCTIHYVNLVIFLHLVLNLDTFFKNFDFLEIFILSFFFEEDLLLIWRVDICVDKNIYLLLYLLLDKCVLIYCIGC